MHTDADTHKKSGKYNTQMKPDLTGQELEFIPGSFP